LLKPLLLLLKPLGLLPLVKPLGLVKLPSRFRGARGFCRARRLRRT
jgi:hypothetical protein